MRTFRLSQRAALFLLAALTAVAEQDHKKWNVTEAVRTPHIL